MCYLLHFGTATSTLEGQDRQSQTLIRLQENKSDFNLVYRAATVELPLGTCLTTSSCQQEGLPRLCHTELPDPRDGTNDCLDETDRMENSSESKSGSGIEDLDVQLHATGTKQ